MNDKELVKLAFQAREQAYAPYSDYLVGAALLAKNGQVFLGCNVENAAYSPSNCAERTAFFNAISQGVREFEAIAIVGGERDTPQDGFSYTFPCGVCRQVMLEFCEAKEFRIITAKSVDEITSATLEQLVPMKWPEHPLGKSTTPR
ncbi:cytidine deaminase [Christensenellaceae bacterium OttesenSCG-928-K19]|nr:cytidine deaminase [Christensenellaceae bacterium OttesenSCG-928-K19]